MRKSALFLSAAVVALGMVVADASVALAKGPPTAGAASGTVSCSVNAVLSFSPPLQASATGNSNVSLSAQLTKCTTTSSMHKTTGHLSGSVGTVASNSCTAPSAPAFSNLSVRWTPSSKVAGSMVSDASAGTNTTLSNGKGQTVYSGVTVTGSFATTTGTLTMTTKNTVAHIGALCSGSGVGVIPLRGSANL